ncbi:transcriptional regulator, TrmB [Halorhabdus utahensis DSM 12940]|uniref:Transcriptional regulator, TrmB n=1 Tax=Halorhabdus utahensis (strain DSM 12940 / JCM 11049 / AX-2) TaxID=519442 RepID=C7NPG1_HALUD|nr:helix-turn-helix domain-containing protein [Halorhabdus utahensis]ACV12716.1 transcriptional regulator, TrmB [Halorhabdus utahensis DSM 12940]
MTEQDVLDSLETLGLSNYEAQVFLALQRLGTGTAQDVSDVSDVPRSQVYGAAEDLAEKGLVEVVEASPKAYRSVTLATARDVLTERLERERTRAFEHLESIRTQDDERDASGDVSTLRGRQSIDDRVAALVERAAGAVVFVAPTADSLTDDIVTALAEKAASGVSVTVVTADPALRARFPDAVSVFVMSEDNPADFAGRALMVDDRSVLLAVETDEGPLGEEAMWTGNSRIGRILAEFMRSGMESGRERQ